MHIKLRDVSYVYQADSPFSAVALSDINLEIAQGEFVALLGHSGSGKSTLAQVIAGLLSSTSGEVVLDGQTAEKNRIFHQVGLVFQYPEQQFFAETVEEEVGFAAKNKGLTEEQTAQIVRESLLKVGLEADEFLKRSPFELSGGQRRRVALAGILAMNPQVLIFDEPTAGLDESGKQWFLQLVRQAHQEGKTIIWITHDMEDSLIAQRILIMYQGELVLSGNPYEVFSDQERLLSWGVGIPVAAQLLRRLKKAGFAVKAEGLTITEAFAEINAALQGGWQ
ncbi:MAG: ATP-binding cassette domain-containing protein [Bacillota bacterium]|jgi:energy-coupling factor transport system ATP-binding protein